MSPSEAYSDLGGTGAPTAPAPDAKTAELIDRLSAAANRSFAPATLAALHKLLDSYDYAVAKAMVDSVTALERVPSNIIDALKKAYWARQSSKSGAVSGQGVLPREEWVEVYEGADDCEHCRAPVYVVRENAGRNYKDTKELNYIRTHHRLYYTCGECGYSASRIVPAKDFPPGHPRRWDIGTKEDIDAYNALMDEVKLWHKLGLVETRANLKGQVLAETIMSAEVWIQAGCPQTWSPIWDEIHKGYPAACNENRVKKYCDDWRARLERGRAERTARRVAS